MDLTAAMLAQARERIADAGWTNIELVHADLAAWEFPTDAAAML